MDKLEHQHDHDHNDHDHAHDHVAAGKKPSLMSMLTPVQLFVGGIITGLLVLCTIGFFVVLLSGGNLSFGGGSSGGTDRMNAGIPGGLPGLAKKAGVKNAKQFQTCLDEKKYASKKNNGKNS